MPQLSVLIPVFNEEAQLAAVLKRVVEAPCPVSREFIVVDDCSTDGTGEILKKLEATPGLTVLTHKVNLGKGAAIATAIAQAKGELIVIQDADFEYDPADIPALLTPLLQEKADVVYGSRFLAGSRQVHRTYHYFVNKFLTLLSNLFSGIYLTDMETCYKVFRADLLKAMQLKSQRFGIEVEVTAYIAKTRARIQELPISYQPRTRLQGKKINWKDGVAALFHLVRFNFLTSLTESFRSLPDAYHPSKRSIPVSAAPAQELPLEKEQ